MDHLLSKEKAEEKKGFLFGFERLDSQGKKRESIFENRITAKT